ncbi:MAG TPA: 3-isopropylmalate dehydratase small subunit [Candidatus Thermoplasmatota archaeon]|nr:3-isopropylmalate dehydratase small subunit [Candidatus Thermoplasmatota archaeon]
MLRGPALRLGDDLNTDVIIPARFMQNWETLGDHVFEGESPDLPKRAKASKFVVAGKNFGCGSSREQAVMAIKQAGVQVVIAKSFARIFYRNAINLALPILEADATDLPDGAEIEVDLVTGKITEVATGRVFQGKGLPPEAKAIVDAGGLIEHLKKRFAAEGKPGP